MNKEIYQGISFNYYSPRIYRNYETNSCVRLENDYSYYDVIGAFIEFSQTIGFDMTRDDILQRLRNYIDENTNYDLKGDSNAY